MAGVFIMGNLRVLGLHTLAKRGKAKGNSFPGAGRGAAYPTPYTPAFRPFDLVPSGLVGAVPGLDPLGSSGCAESEEPDGSPTGRALSSNPSRVLARGWTYSCESRAIRRGLRCGQIG